ncbi:MAG TPA: fibronectin type III domain-containing protein, partial [Candidatus Hydrogenedentes bacterium]|nr:fibronectin type III domain-containing protein [Candidatus Hydrogenedentota bacterium]
DAATGYKVFRSTNGYGFDNGTAVSASPAVVSGLTQGNLYFFRVCATNGGGQSFPTETLAVRLPETGGAQALLVNGFDRNNNTLPPRETVTNAGIVCRVEPWRFQTFDYTVQHALAMHAAGISFDGSCNEAVAGGSISLSGYQAAFWICGEESTGDETLSSAEQTVLNTFLSTSGKCLFISGSEIVWDLVSQGSTSDQDFSRNVMRADYTGDDAGTYQAQGTAGPFSGLGSFSFAVADGACYDADYPDQLSVINGSVAAMTYVGGSGGTAAVSYDGSVKVIVMGIPFETIASSSIRANIMSRTANFFNLTTGPTPTPIPTPTPTPVPSQFIVENFESYTAGTTAVFQKPTYSGSTTGVVAASDSSAVSTEAANNILDPLVGAPGTKSYKVAWTWTTAGTGFIRLTTANTVNKPNPMLDFTKGLSLYLNLPAGQIDLQLQVRETGGSGPIGANGGTTGAIERTATKVRINSSGSWQYVYFNLPSETWMAFTGNGVLDGTWGTLEALVISAVSGDPTTAFVLYVDDIYQG